MTREPDWRAIAAELTSGLGAPGSTAEQLRRLLDAIRQVVPFDAAALLRVEGGVLLPVAAMGLDDEVMGRRFAPSAHPRFEQLLTSPIPVRFDADTTLPDPYDGLIGDAPDLVPVHDCMGGRLQVEGRVWGVLTLDALTPGAFADVEGALGGLIAWVEASVATIEALTALRERLDRPHSPLRRAAPERERPRRTLVGSSSALEALRSEIATVAPSDLSVLILGETGVGKELVAEHLHAGSGRRDAPLVHVNCAALPENLAETELFGHDKGAYTGATRDRIGKFELADHGTIFLDEVGELAPSVQAKLLRVLQSGELQRPGSDRHLHVDVRVLAATNRDLREEVARGRFRGDLYHRLSVFPLVVPPLRARESDVLALAGAFLEENQQRLGARNLRLTKAAKDALLRYPWPGNVRELEHVISRAALRAVARHGRSVRVVAVDEESLGILASPSMERPREARSRATLPIPATRASLHVPGANLREATDAFQRRWLEGALARNDGNQAAVAREAGIHRSNLSRLLKRLGVPLLRAERGARRG